MEPRFLPAKSRIQLTDAESALFAKLLEVAEAAKTNTTLRVAGGWVRDKILGLHSDDIDIALDNMMGEAFANHIVAHMKTGRHLGIVKANPEASKHLETACIHVMGFELDIVNLRSEDYSSDSRIPQIVSNIQTFGTPSQDAFRRDLTINSMFYNLGKEEIEDWTGRGIEDLDGRVARTPLPPMQTFLDDPLRVLRTIRFTARFNLTMDPEIRDAAVEEPVRKSLFTKVSRERICKEYTLMAKGNNPFGALELLQSLRMIDILLKVPQEFPDESESSYSTATHLHSFPFPPDNPQSPLNTFITLTSALISPYRHLFHRLPKKKSPTPLPEIICADSLKVPITQLSNDDSRRICILLANIDHFIESLAGGDVVEFGLVLRKIGADWELAARLAAAIGKEPLTQYYDRVVEFIHQHELGRVWEEKPLLNGAEIANLLHLSGPAVGKALELVVKWQIMNRTGTKEGCEEYLRANTASLH